METTVVIDMHLLDIRIFQVFQQFEYEQVQQVWGQEDPELKQMTEDEPAFAGVTCWRDMTPFQYRLLITQVLDHLSALDAENFSQDMPLFRRLRFFVAALALKSRDLLAQNIDLLRIQSVGFSKADFVLEASQTICLETEMGGDADPSGEVAVRGGFRIVVDNTKEPPPERGE